MTLLHEQKSRTKLRFLPQRQMPSFQDPEIQQISHSYFCDPVPDTGNHDVERPSKRARIAAVDSDPTMIDMRSNIVSKIYSLLGLQVDKALSGLSQNAVYVTTMPFSV